MTSYQFDLGFDTASQPVGSAAGQELEVYPLQQAFYNIDTGLPQFCVGNGSNGGVMGNDYLTLRVLDLSTESGLRSSSYFGASLAFYISDLNGAAALGNQIFSEMPPHAGTTNTGWGWTYGTAPPSQPADSGQLGFETGTSPAFPGQLPTFPLVGSFIFANPTQASYFRLSFAFQVQVGSGPLRTYVSDPEMIVERQG